MLTHKQTTEQNY